VRFYRGSADQQGNIKGYSYGCFGYSIGVFFGILFTALLIGWPLLIHGPAGMVLEVFWIIIGGSIALITLSNRSAQRAGRHQAAPAPEAPVFDGDKPDWYKPPEDERPKGRSIGTKFQS
jgi:hypothetical protein